jgi:uncharacterized protein (DUF488 family)
MQIFTSYFGNLKDLIKANLHPIGIAISQPKWYKGTNFKNLAPKYEMINWPEDRYTPEFKKILLNQNAKLVFDQMRSFSGGKDVVLLCYEMPGQFCHRRLVAEWFEKELGIEVKEFVRKDERIRQTTLF